RVDAAQDQATGTCARRKEFLVRAVREHAGTQPLGQLERLAQGVPRLRAPIGAPQRRAKVRQRMGVLETSGRLAEDLHGLLDVADAGLAPLGQPESAERAPERARRS